MQSLPEERVAEILNLLPVDARRDIQRLGAYPEGTAGALMTTEVAMLRSDLTAPEALEELGRQASDVETIYYLYVVDENQLLLGVVSTRQLVSSLNKPSRTLAEMMVSDVIAASVTEHQEEVAQKVEKYNLLAIPVVDDARHCRNHHT